MALLKDISIRWKLSFALVSSGLTLVVIYVAMAKGVFEGDKISYVFESQSSKLESMRREIDIRLERAIFVSRAMIAMHDPATSSFLPGAKDLFFAEKDLQALQLSKVGEANTIMKLEKNVATLATLSNPSIQLKPGKILVSQLPNENLLIQMLLRQTESEFLLLELAVKTAHLLPPGSPSQSFALALNGSIIANSKLNDAPENLFQQILESSGNSAVEKTSTLRLGPKNYLVVTKPLSFDGLILLSATPESDALGALDSLFRRSIIFVLFSAFGLMLISLWLSAQMTKGIKDLTLAAVEVGRGNFNSVPKNSSKDEIGVLSRAFERMAEEITNLLIKTREGARMEQELKTASLIQERLLPHNPIVRSGNIEVSGQIRTSSECGGDWWYYHVRGEEIFIAIADATGHGTPAALITAAATSIFARLEDENLSLREMMHAWDKSVFKCSGEQVMMTGILMRINTRSGLSAYISAAHEAPFFFRENDDKSFAYEELDFPISPRIGTLFKSIPDEVAFQLSPGDVIVLYTDGLFSVAKEAGKSLSERRFCKYFASKIGHFSGAREIMNLAFSVFDDYRGEDPLPDDISIVCIRHHHLPATS